MSEIFVALALRDFRRAARFFWFSRAMVRRVPSLATKTLTSSKGAAPLAAVRLREDSRHLARVRVRVRVRVRLQLG